MTRRAKDVANEEAIGHYATVRQIAYMTGDSTVPTENVIDLAQAIMFLFEQHYEGIDQ